MYRKVLLMTIGVLFVTAASHAGPSGTVGCYSEASVSCPGMRLCICPSNDFEFIRDACDGGYIEVWVRNPYTGEGIPEVPWTDYWINACDPAQELCLCVQPVVADSLTSGLPGFEGRTTISGRITGGGCVLTGGLWIAVQGLVFTEGEYCEELLCLDIVIVSPDINGDCSVSLSDFQLFCQSYNKSEGMPDYNGCCDFTDDGECSLADFAFFAQHYNHQCW
jgi:hypothetical protein